jgi:heme-degrading monooxygenase HmoA
MSGPSQPVFRIDQFKVPKASMVQFMRVLDETHALLKTQRGFVRDYVLQQPCNAGAENLLTVVEWEDQCSYAEAVAAVQSFRGPQFNPKEILADLKIEATMGTFAEVR